jgi:hypothetical protein
MLPKMIQEGSDSDNAKMSIDTTTTTTYDENKINEINVSMNGFDFRHRCRPE